MAYTPTVWTNDALPAINATNLNKIEGGIQTADNAANSAQATASSADGKADTNKTDLDKFNGGTTGQVLTKASGADKALIWSDPAQTGVPEAPNDGFQYGRAVLSWVKIAVLEAPIDTKSYARKDGAWVEVIGGGGATSYLDLSDTPATFTPLYYPRVNSAGDAIVFTDTQPTSGVPEAPIDGSIYGRKDGTWVESGGGLETPSITGPSSEFMGTPIVITMSNYGPDLTYSWTNLNSVVDNTNGTFSGVLPDVPSTDPLWEITVFSSKLGFTPSGTGSHIMENKFQAFTESIEIDVNSSNIPTEFVTLSNTVTTGGIIMATADGGTAISNAQTAIPAVTFKKVDVGQATVTHTSAQGFADIPNTSDTVDQLKTTFSLANGDFTYLQKADKSIVKVLITNSASPYTYTPTIAEVPLIAFVDNTVSYEMDSVTTGYQDATLASEVVTAPITSDTDPFGDGSLKFSCEFNGNLTDNMGTSTLSAVGGAVSYIKGKFRQALSGIGTSVYVASNDAVIPATVSTASFFIKFTGTTVVNNNGMFCWGNISDGGVCSFAVGGSFTSKMWVGLEVGYLEADGATITNDDKFHHILIERNGVASTTAVELDGIAVPSTWVNSGGFAVIDGTRIGAGSTNVTPNLNIAIDQAQIFNRLLTTQEKQDIREAGYLKVTRQHNAVLDAIGATTIKIKITLKALGSIFKTLTARVYE